MDKTHHLRHTLEQVLRFSAMLGGSCPADRPVSVLYAQLGFNLGRYGELAQADGRQLWRTYEACIETQIWEPLQTWAQDRLDRLPSQS